MQTKNAIVIEMTAVIKLTESLLRTGIVKPQISENDKTPSWDGDLEIYEEGKSFSKNSLQGRIPVQVKGTVVKEFPSKSYAVFQVDVSDLKNYLNDGGALFFVVQLRGFDDFRIYYADLLPFDLRRLLNQAGTCQSKQIQLKQFPHQNLDDMIRILLDFLENRKKQAIPSLGINSLYDLQNSEIEVAQLEITLHTYGLNCMEDVLNQMFRQPHYVYALPPKIPISFVVDKVWIEQIIMQRDSSVYVNGERLFEQIDVIRKANGTNEIQIGKNFTMTLESNGYIRFRNDIKGTLCERIRMMKFLVAFVNGEDIRIGHFQLPSVNANLHNCKSNKITEYLYNLQRYQKILEMLHVKKDLQMDDLSELDMGKLHYLADSVLDHVAVPFYHAHPGVGTLQIGNITLLIFLRKTSNEKEFMLMDFSDDIHFKLTPKGVPLKEGIPVSPYIILTLDLMERVDNIDFDAIVPSIIHYPYHTVYGGRIWDLSQELLKYYDLCKRPNLLGIVIQLMAFLQENDPDQEVLYQINCLQTQKRRRKLTTEEIQYLLKVKNTIKFEQIQLMVNILLESFQEAQMIYNALEEQERESFDRSPIKNIWNRPKD